MESQNYFDSGELSVETPYTNDIKEGKEIWYYRNGNIGREVIFKNDKAIEGYNYDYETAKKIKMTNAHFSNLGYKVD